MKATDALKRKKDEGLVKTLSMAAQAAEEGANDTAAMKAKVGRASHVSPDCCTRNDPGAEAVAIIFRSVSDTIANAQERKPCFKYSSCCSMRCDRKNKNC